MAHSGISKAVVITVVAILTLILAVIVFSAVTAVQGESRGWHNMHRLDGLRFNLSQYAKRYGWFPALTDMQSATLTDIRQARNPGGQPACLALKLLMQDGFVEDAKAFFSPFCDPPTEATLMAMTQNLDPREDPTWAGSYAYDPGHKIDHGPTVLLGDTEAVMRANSDDFLYVITCQLVIKEFEANPQGQFVIERHGADGSSQVNTDNIFTDDAAAFGWRDSYLQCDVPSELPKP